MEHNKKQCYMCRNFDRLYTKGVKRYNRTKYGYCKVKCGNVGIHEYCIGFTMKPRVKAGEKTVLYCLNDLLTEISEVRNVLEDELDDSEEV